MTAVLRSVFLGACLNLAMPVGAREAVRDQAADAAAPRLPEEVSSCAECHRETYAEWKASMHHGSWTSSLVQERLHRLKQDEASCAGCHAARLEFDGKGGVSRKARPSGRELGVSCRTCHCTADCIILGPRDPGLAKGGPGRSSVVAEAKAEALCRTCHEATQKSFDGRPTAMREKSCIDCHMPVAARAEAGAARPASQGDAITRRRHTFRGGHDADFVAGALRVTVAPDGAVSVVNVGAGHAIPFAPVRTLFVTMTARDDSGEILATERAEIGSKNPILAGAAWSGQSPMPKGTASVTARITYRLVDYQPEAEHMAVATVERRVR